MLYYKCCKTDIAIFQVFVLEDIIRMSFTKKATSTPKITSGNVLKSRYQFDFCLYFTFLQKKTQPAFKIFFTCFFLCPGGSLLKRGGANDKIVFIR